MPSIETQGISEDYSTATGNFESIDRGDVSKSDLFEILHKVAKLSSPTEDACPPTVNAKLSGDRFSCFYGESGQIHCSDSAIELMSPEEAVHIICGEQTIAEYDTLKGYVPQKKNGSIYIFAFVLIVIITILITGSN